MRENGQKYINDQKRYASEVVSMGAAAVAIGYEKQMTGFVGCWMMLGRDVLH